MIVVIGSSGMLGRRVVERLRDEGRTVTAASRNPAKADLPSGVERVAVDLRDPDSIRTATHGATEVVMAAHGLNPPGWRNGPSHVDDRGAAALCDALAGSGTHVTFLSLIGADDGHPLEFWRAKRAGERHLERSGLPFAIVRSAAFMEFHSIELLGKPLRKHKSPFVIGVGNRVRNTVSVDDVADLVVWAVTNRFEGTLEAIGPENRSPNDEIAVIAEVLGADPKARHIQHRVATVIARVLRPAVPNIARIIAISLHDDGRDQPLNPSPLPPGAPRPTRTLADVTKESLTT